jgi:hypothetical protein
VVLSPSPSPADEVSNRPTRKKRHHRVRPNLEEVYGGSTSWYDVETACLSQGVRPLGQAFREKGLAPLRHAHLAVRRPTRTSTRHQRALRWRVGDLVLRKWASGFLPRCFVRTTGSNYGSADEEASRRWTCQLRRCTLRASTRT